MEMHRVAGHHRLAKARLVDRHEEHQLACVGVAKVVQHQRTRRLRHGLDEKNARHHRAAWEMPLEEWFVDGDILDRRAALLAVEIDHLVNQQKGIAVRQQLHDACDIRRREGLLSGIFGHCLFPE